jgi:serine/threonine-protein kinase
VSVPRRPETLGPYEVIAKIAGGGMATIYLGRARDATGAESAVAVKVIRHDLKHDERFVRMFLDEAKILSLMSHPNICRTLEYGSDIEHHFIAMELLLGRPLQDVLDACKVRKLTLRVDMCAWIGARIATALHYAHRLKGADGESLGLVHRDVSPSNVFLTYDGNVKLLDFGLARSTGRRQQSVQGIAKGKVAYLSPEQVMQLPIDHRSDIFSLAVTLWEATTMRRLFRRRDDIETLHAIRAGLVPDPRARDPGYPEGLWHILKRALSRDPFDRHPSAEAFSNELDLFVAKHQMNKGQTTHIPGLIGGVLDTLFEGERERQSGWLRRTSQLDPSSGRTTTLPPGQVADARPSAHYRTARKNPRDS